MLIGELFGTPSHKFVKSIASSGKSIFLYFKRHSFQGIVGFQYLRYLIVTIYILTMIANEMGCKRIKQQIKIKFLCKVLNNFI